MILRPDVSFHFAATDEPGTTDFSLTRGGRLWCKRIPMPYPAGDSFWSSGRWTVVDEVAEMAQKHGAPEWAFREVLE